MRTGLGLPWSLSLKGSSCVPAHGNAVREMKGHISSTTEKTPQGDRLISVQVDAWFPHTCPEAQPCQSQFATASFPGQATQRSARGLSLIPLPGSAWQCQAASCLSDPILEGRVVPGSAHTAPCPQPCVQRVAGGQELLRGACSQSSMPCPGHRGSFSLPFLPKGICWFSTGAAGASVLLAGEGPCSLRAGGGTGGVYGP